MNRHHTFFGAGKRASLVLFVGLSLFATWSGSGCSSARDSSPNTGGHTGGSDAGGQAGGTAATGGQAGDRGIGGMGGQAAGGKGGGVQGGRGGEGQGGAQGGVGGTVAGGQGGQGGDNGGQPGGQGGQGGQGGVCAHAAENGACLTDGTVCGTCTDACHACNRLICQSGHWVRQESAPAPCFACDSQQCRKNAEYCHKTEGGAVGNSPSYSCRAIPSTCPTTPTCACLSGIPNLCMEIAPGELSVTQQVP